MSEIKQLEELAAPTIKEFPLSNGKKAKIGPFSIQAMLEIERAHGDFNEWAKRVVDPSKVSIADVAEMMWLLCINKEDFRDKEELLTGFPAKVSWLNEVKIVLLEVLKDSVQSEEKVGGSAAGN